jgi:molybdopterin-guanine dinucleotide biosynthesis protein A
VYTDITGIILAGGKSTRMGANKSLLKLGEQTVIERITYLMKSVFTNIIIISNTPDEYTFLNLPIYEDVYKGKGPLAGIHSGLKSSDTQKNFIISCDIPLMNKEMIEYIVEYKTDKPITVCNANGFLQPFAGLYDKSLVNEIENRLCDKSEHINHTNENERKQCKVMSFIRSTDAEVINPADANDYSENTFLNINTQEDYNNLLAIINK